MNPIRYLSRIATVLAGAVLAFAAGVPAAFAIEQPPQPADWGKHPPPPSARLPGSVHTVHTVPMGGMPGWQITLIAIGAALLAATAAVVVDRARRHRDHAVPGQPSAEPARHAQVSR